MQIPSQSASSPGLVPHRSRGNRCMNTMMRNPALDPPCLFLGKDKLQLSCLLPQPSNPKGKPLCSSLPHCYNTRRPKFEGLTHLVLTVHLSKWITHSMSRDNNNKSIRSMELPKTLMIQGKVLQACQCSISGGDDKSGKDNHDTDEHYCWGQEMMLTGT